MRNRISKPVYIKVSRKNITSLDKGSVGNNNFQSLQKWLMLKIDTNNQ